MESNAEIGDNIPLEQAIGKFFTTPCRKRVEVLSVDLKWNSVLVMSGFWTRPQHWDFELLIEGGPKHCRANPTSHVYGCDW